MHKKILLSLLLSSSLISSQELRNERFQLVAKNVDSVENIVTASGEVVIYSPSYYLSANKVIYNKENDGKSKMAAITNRRAGQIFHSSLGLLCPYDPQRKMCPRKREIVGRLICV